MWDICFKAAINKDGSLLFPEKLSIEFLENARRTQGSLIFSNQYMNKVIDEESQPFKKAWIRYYELLPSTKLNTFAFIDPAISQNIDSDFTGITVVSIDSDDNRYLLHAARKKLTPTQIIEEVFKIQRTFHPMCIGIETQAYQEALLYMLDQESRRRGVIIPIKGIKHGTHEAKDKRIMGLVPYFEFGRYYLKPGLTDFEDELLSFPRGGHDDIIDSLSSIEKIAIKPEKEIRKDEQPNPADAANYEQWYRRQLHQGRVPTKTNEYEQDQW